MSKNLKSKVCKLLIMALIFGSISTTGWKVEAFAAEEKQTTQQQTSAPEEEATMKEETTTVLEETTIEDSTEEPSGEESTEESTTEEFTTEDTTPEETTTEITTPEETTSEITTPEEPTKIPGKVKWKGKVVPGATMKGIDVSHHNGDINWKKVAASDVDYAIIRCGYGSNLISQDDRKWEQNVEGCEKNKIPYGVYIYSYATTTAGAVSEAKHVLRLIQGHQLSFPVYFDMEDDTQARLSSSKKKQIADTFLQIISSSGYECSIYANLNWWNDHIPSLADIVQNKWVAQYNNTCEYQGTYAMWQCTSQEKVNGIQGDVDLNFWYGEVRTAKYDIYKKVTVKRPKRMKVKKVTVGKKTATLQWKEKKNVVAYQIQYSRYKSFKYYQTKTTIKTKKKITNLKQKKTYYFRIRCYRYKKTNRLYSKWSKKVRKKIK